MIRIDKTKTFVLDYNSSYTKDICLPLSREIFDYINNILIDSVNGLGLSRFDSYGNHSEVNWDGTYTGSYSTVLLAKSMVGYYRLNDQDNNILILEVNVGRRENYRGDITYVPSTWTYQNQLSYNINFYFSRTLINENIWRSILVNSTSSTTLDINNYFIQNSVLLNAAIRGEGDITITQSNHTCEVTIPLQIIKTNSNKFISLNNYQNGLPRIGIVQTGVSQKLGKAFIFNQNTNFYRDDDYKHSASKILVLGNEKPVGYYTSNILREKTFDNLGDKIPTMPMYPGYTPEETDPTILNLAEPLTGFLQTSANFLNTKDSRYTINNNSYTNIGNSILMHD